ncbi:uncharacterized protein K460DRAFT_403438 [Cucurbitaria berberidis CBS 394.84]|uniref:Uncharacterized protein n=1 Tax=Cucurbitaria berberidis CBS 394.84 TaxID=1168544 RepID=A0A9P4GN80_9PLEO|nr:uncharacterized protein K460DRAFT_403438 [Cucurbitaria berberidis CBS 394.84]KAF1848141.1 hypothetical protein K460DRAFT_403438 [Cucurbitaria berberidis CBS 394.84]
MVPVQFKITELPYDPVNTPRSLPSPQQPANLTVDYARAIAVRSVFFSRQNSPRGPFGYAIGSVRLGQSFAWVQAVLDLEESDSDDILHWSGDDVGEEVLRDFQVLSLDEPGSNFLFGRAALAGSSADAVFRGTQYDVDDSPSEMIAAKMVLNKKGRWIGDEIQDMDHYKLNQMNVEFPRETLELIGYARQVLGENEAMEKREAGLEERESAVEKREKAM